MRGVYIYIFFNFTCAAGISDVPYGMYGCVAVIAETAYAETRQATDSGKVGSPPQDQVSRLVTGVSL